MRIRKSIYTRCISVLNLFFIVLLVTSQAAVAVIPRPDHVVICVLENHAYQQIAGSSAAPYINNLINESANMQEYYAMTHPSQPNYIMLFSGADQGETTNNLPVGTPWSTLNLGGSLINSGFSFIGYSEDLPGIGSTVGTSGAYARKHSPWIHWQGTGTNQIPADCNLPFSEFPSDYDSLPDLCFVIPNQDNDMHNGSDPGRIEIGDQWVEHNLKPYVDWAWNNNSLFILTFDEDNFTTTNQVMCLFIGPMVRKGNYYLKGYNHYDLLRTLEDMFGLPYSGNSAFAKPIDEIWMTTVGMDHFSSLQFSGFIFPNPAVENSQLIIINKQQEENNEVYFLIYDAIGNLRKEEIFSIVPGINTFPFNTAVLSSGFYTYILRNDDKKLSSGSVIVN